MSVSFCHFPTHTCNEAWGDFFVMYPNAGVSQIEDYARGLAQRFGFVVNS